MNYKTLNTVTIELNDNADKYDCQCLRHRMNTAARRSLMMIFNHQAFALVSWGYENDSLPCTADISEHYDVFAGDMKGRPTITIIITLYSFEQSQHDNQTSFILSSLLF